MTDGLGGGPTDGRLPVGPDTQAEGVVAAVRTWVEDVVPQAWVEAGRRGGPSEVRTVRTRADIPSVVPRLRRCPALWCRPGRSPTVA